jgi:two-component system, OmpR family, sensor kinase
MLRLRSLFAKIFLCTLVIYPVSRGIGFSMLYLLSPSPPPPPPEILRRVLSLLSVEVACCVLVSYLLARYLARPLRNLHNAAIAFAGGDFSARGQEVKAERRDEVAQLVRAFNSMADHISALIQAQQRFIVDVSHEIKSPFARLSLAAALARRAASPLAAEQFDRLEREIETASSLVRDLQVLSSLQDGAPPPRCEMLDLAALLAAAIDNVTFEWQGHPHDIKLTAPSEPVITRGDPPVLQRAVENVLQNALFYTPKGTYGSRISAE